jgi:hypothetical protein
MPNKLSTEYVRLPVTVTKTDGTSYDPTGDTVQVALTALNTQPVTADWHTGSWETGQGVHYALLLVGPTPGVVDFSAVAGQFVKAGWVKVTDSPEVPVLGPYFITFT